MKLAFVINCLKLIRAKWCAGKKPRVLKECVVGIPYASSEVPVNFQKKKYNKFKNHRKFMRKGMGNLQLKVANEFSALMNCN